MLRMPELLPRIFAAPLRSERDTRLAAKHLAQSSLFPRSHDADPPRDPGGTVGRTQARGADTIHETVRPGPGYGRFMSGLLFGELADFQERVCRSCVRAVRLAWADKPRRFTRDVF